MVSTRFPFTFHSGRHPDAMLLRMRHRRVAHPRALLPRVHARPKPLAIARSVALDNAIELVPIDRPEIVMLALGIPLELRIGHADAEVVRLRDSLIDEALAK